MQLTPLLTAREAEDSVKAGFMISVVSRVQCVRSRPCTCVADGHDCKTSAISGGLIVAIDFVVPVLISLGMDAMSASELCRISIAHC